MLGLSFGELFIVFAFILLFFGANSIPKMARTLGRGLRQMKDATQEIQNEIKKSSGGITDEVKKIQDDFKKSTSGITDEVKNFENDVKKHIE